MHYLDCFKKSQKSWPLFKTCGKVIVVQIVPSGWSVPRNASQQLVVHGEDWVGPSTVSQAAWVTSLLRGVASLRSSASWEVTGSLRISLHPGRSWLGMQCGITEEVQVIRMYGKQAVWWSLQYVVGKHQMFGMVVRSPGESQKRKHLFLEGVKTQRYSYTSDFYKHWHWRLLLI